MTLQEGEGSQIDIERIKPDKDSNYLFKRDHIKVMCKVTCEKEITSVAWWLYLKSTSLNVKQKNNTDLRIINKWNSNKTAVQSLMFVWNPPQHPSFYYRCEAETNDDETRRLVKYNYIPEKFVPKVNITDSKVTKDWVTPNGTAEGKYNSSVVLRCKMTFEANDILSKEHVIVVLRKNSRILVVTPKIEYLKAKNLSLEYRISNLDVGDGGVYTFSSKIILGPRTFTTSQYITLTLPLRLTGAMEKEVRSFPGYDVELVCEIEGFPKPTWTFRHGKYEVLGKNMKHEEHRDARNHFYIAGNLLQIRNVQKYHEGLYTCVAADESGDTKTQKIVLKITENNDNGGNKAVKHSLLLLISACLIFATFA